MAVDVIIAMRSETANGASPMDSETLRRVAHEFGWGVRLAGSLSEAIAHSDGNAVAVLFPRDAPEPASTWAETVRRLRAEFAEIPLIACPEFGDRFEWEELAEAGVFHSLWLPLKEEEVRRSFGFLAAATRHRQSGGVRA